ncbi:MAG TPA: DUF4199 domain-containing protein [Vicinamibacterales bacterium]
MTPIPAAGLLIGVLCSLWMFMMGFTGWYKDPSKLNLFFIVIIILMGGLIWGLRRTAAQGRTYSGQVVAGAQMAFVAGLVIFVASLLFTATFPEYFDEVNATFRQMMLKEGKTEAEIQAMLDAAAPSQTPIWNALTVSIGTIVRGIAATALISVWVRAERRVES